MKWLFRIIGFALIDCGIEWFIYFMTHMPMGLTFFDVNWFFLPLIAFIASGVYCVIDLGEWY
jgi:hypothetical protein